MTQAEAALGAARQELLEVLGRANSCGAPMWHAEQLTRHMCMCAGEPPTPPSRLISPWQKLLYGKNEVALVHVLRLQRGKSPEGEDE
jgi:hypothetical protein